MRLVPPAGNQFGAFLKEIEKAIGYGALGDELHADVPVEQQFHRAVRLVQHRVDGYDSIGRWTEIHRSRKGFAALGLIADFTFDLFGRIAIDRHSIVAEILQ